MITVYTDNHQAHHPRNEIYDGRPVPYSEVPDRAGAIIDALKHHNLGEIIAPDQFPIRYLHQIHQREYVHYIRQRSKGLTLNEELFPSYFIRDTYAPLTSGTYRASLSAVDAALTGAQLLVDGERVVYSLCRPPGHHATHSSMGGYCYFNNAAVAANYLSRVGRVSVLDIDLHHGNGTQEAFYYRDDVQYVSIHADPTRFYPYTTGFENERGSGKGAGFNSNHPLPLGADSALYLQTLYQAIDEIQSNQPDYLVVSAGFDTYMHDPIGTFQLGIPVYAEIASLIDGLGLPTLLVQEGGYSVKALGEIASTFLGNFRA